MRTPALITTFPVGTAGNRTLTLRIHGIDCDVVIDRNGSVVDVHAFGSSHMVDVTKWAELLGVQDKVGEYLDDEGPYMTNEQRMEAIS